MNNRKAFTIVELLTSLVIIALLVGLLLPSISAIRRNARDTAQKAQFATIEIALDAFKQDYGDYPPSSEFEETILPRANARDYCGAMKLAEALLGWDLQGFHPKTYWRIDGYSGTNVAVNGIDTYDPARFRGTATLFERKGPYLEVATTSVFHLGTTAAGDGLYNNISVAPFPNPLNPANYVICDVFGVRKIAITDSTGKPIKTVTAGSPILYYKAQTSSKSFVYSVNSDQIYNHTDNHVLLALGKLTASGTKGPPMHPLFYSNGASFYDDEFTYIPATAPGYGGSGIGYGLMDPRITQQSWPYRPDSYILISAGADGLYGTADDIHNY